MTLHIRSWGGALLCACLLCGLCACTAEPPPDSGSTTTSRTALVLLDKDIASLVTGEQVSQIVGTELPSREVKENGQQLYMQSADRAVSVSLNVIKRDRTRFDTSMQAFESKTEAPNLGEAAWWVEEYGALFVYAGGYELNVYLSGVDAEGEDLLVLSRQIAALAVEKL